MACTVKDSDITNYLSRGYVIFEGIVPVSLIRDLRRTAEQYRALVAAGVKPRGGRDALANYDIDHRPVRDYAELPDLLGAIRQVLNCAEATIGRLDRIIFFTVEQTDRPSCKPWHRDVTPKFAYQDQEAIDSFSWRLDSFNQASCPLYRDSSLWYLPGSALRGDTPGELAIHYSNQMKHPAAEVAKMDDCEVERLVIEAARRMPGGMPLQLYPGDFLMYRPQGWHLGMYLPYNIRASLHDTVWTPRLLDWHTGRDRREAEHRAKGLPSPRPHQPLAASGASA